MHQNYKNNSNNFQGRGILKILNIIISIANKLMVLRAAKFQECRSEIAEKIG